jgi:SAM-dependent methyltransferase
VVPDAGGYAVFSFHPRPPEAAADGLSLPPAHLIRVTSGCLRQAVNRPEALYDSYVEAGAQGAACIRAALERFGLAIEDFGSVLDFGCGCGRVIRHWRDLDGGVQGCDYNPLLVDWCQSALGFATFERNGLEPPLPYADSSFDFLYAISLFTHFDANQQIPWMRELTRVVSPGGVLLVTVGGESRATRQLDGTGLERFRAGELVVRRADLAGTNACAAFHPRRYIEEELAAGLELLGVIPDGAQDVRQDQVLLRKPATGGSGG